jgi:flagellar basal-body rod protein FlgB
MIHHLFESTSIPVLEQVVNFAQTRHGVLAGNLANLDTPGYQVRDLSEKAFEGRLKQAIHERDESHVRVSQSDLTKQVEDSFEKVNGDLEDFLYHDTSTGNLESQVAAINKNQMQHNLAIALLSSQFRLMQAAISERV